MSARCPECDAPARNMPPDGDYRYDNRVLRSAVVRAEAAEAQVERLKGELGTAQKELKATQLVSLHLINELEEIASYDTASECDEFDEEEQVEADVLIKRARSALEAKP